MSLLLRPSVLTNHAYMLGIFFFVSFLMLPIIAAFIAMGDVFRFGSVLGLVGVWPQSLWIIAVSIKLQSWNRTQTPQLIWAFVWLMIAISFVFALSEVSIQNEERVASDMLRTGLTWFAVANICMSWQIASAVTVGFVNRALFTMAVLLWPFFLSLFNHRLRKQLELVHLKSLVITQ